MKIIRKNAFTLAEVLVTLAVVGVVAALTMPAITKSYQKQEWINKYKSTYSIINQSTKMIMADNGGSLLGSWDASDDQGMFDAYEPYLKIAQIGNYFGTGYTDLDGSNWNFFGSYNVLLVNGSALSFYAMAGANASNNLNRIIIDINAQKGPNIYGKDLHEIDIRINSDPVKPKESGTSDANIAFECPSNLSYSGSSCGLRMLRGDYGEDY